MPNFLCLCRYTEHRTRSGVHWRSCSGRQTSGWYTNTPCVNKAVMIHNTDACSGATISVLIFAVWQVLEVQEAILLYCQLTITSIVTVAAVASNSASEGSTVLYVLVLWFDFSISALYVLRFQFICTSCTMAFDTLNGDVCFHVRCFMFHVLCLTLHLLCFLYAQVFLLFGFLRCCHCVCKLGLLFA